MMVKIHKTVEGGSDIMKFVKKESGCINCGARLRIKRGRDGEIWSLHFVMNVKSGKQSISSRCKLRCDIWKRNVGHVGPHVKVV